MKWWKTRAEPVPVANYSALDVEELMELTRSYDGYQREAAVVELARRAAPQAIACLLVCCGDWVRQVSGAARQGVAMLMRDELVAYWAKALPELAFVFRVRRTDLSDLIKSIEAFLGRNVEALERHAHAPDSRVRRWLLSLRLNQPLTEQALLDLLLRGVGTSDLPIARLCLEADGRLQNPFASPRSAEAGRQPVAAASRADHRVARAYRCPERR